MQWIPNDEHKRRDEAFADFIGGVAYEEDRGWSKEVWDAAWSARREWVGLTDEEVADIANGCRWSDTYHADFAHAIEIGRAHV